MIQYTIQVYLSTINEILAFNFKLLISQVCGITFIILLISLAYS